MILPTIVSAAKNLRKSYRQFMMNRRSGQPRYQEVNLGEGHKKSSGQPLAIVRGATTLVSGMTFFFILEDGNGKEGLIAPPRGVGSGGNGNNNSKELAIIKLFVRLVQDFVRSHWFINNKLFEELKQEARVPLGVDMDAVEEILLGIDTSLTYTYFRYGISVQSNPAEIVEALNALSCGLIEVKKIDGQYINCVFNLRAWEKFGINADDAYALVKSEKNVDEYFKRLAEQEKLNGAELLRKYADSFGERSLLKARSEVYKTLQERAEASAAVRFEQEYGGKEKFLRVLWHVRKHCLFMYSLKEEVGLTSDYDSELISYILVEVISAINSSEDQAEKITYTSGYYSETEIRNHYKMIAEISAGLVKLTGDRKGLIVSFSAWKLNEAPFSAEQIMELVNESYLSGIGEFFDRYRDSQTVPEVEILRQDQSLIADCARELGVEEKKLTEAFKSEPAQLEKLFDETLADGFGGREALKLVKKYYKFVRVLGLIRSRPTRRGDIDKEQIFALSGAEILEPETVRDVLRFIIVEATSNTDVFARPRYYENPIKGREFQKDLRRRVALAIGKMTAGLVAREDMINYETLKVDLRAWEKAGVPRGIVSALIREHQDIMAVLGEYLAKKIGEIKPKEESVEVRHAYEMGKQKPDKSRPLDREALIKLVEEKEWRGQTFTATVLDKTESALSLSIPEIKKYCLNRIAVFGSHFEGVGQGAEIKVRIGGVSERFATLHASLAGRLGSQPGETGVTPVMSRKERKKRADAARAAKRAKTKESKTDKKPRVRLTEIISTPTQTFDVSAELTDVHSDPKGKDPLHLIIQKVVNDEELSGLVVKLMVKGESAKEIVEKRLDKVLQGIEASVGGKAKKGGKRQKLKGQKMQRLIEIITNRHKYPEFIGQLRNALQV